jgi:hypothetical protein
METIKTAIIFNKLRSAKNFPFVPHVLLTCFKTLFRHSFSKMFPSADSAFAQYNKTIFSSSKIIESRNATGAQGEQIGTFFALWVIHFFGQFFFNLRK